MISYNRAKKILRSSKIIVQNELIKSSDCLNRVAAQDVLSKSNNPSGDNAAFDGYAINSKDTKNLNSKKIKLFKILRTVAAGDKPNHKKIKKFQTVEIMTGGLLTEGFDTIIPIEQIIYHPNRKNPKNIVINKRIKKNQHVRFKGSDYKKNDLLIKKGTIIQPNHILAFKTLGIKNIKVYNKPKIGILSTGNEIIDINSESNLNKGQIYDSNRPTIISLLNEYKFNNVIDLGIIDDNLHNMKNKFDIICAPYHDEHKLKVQDYAMDV